MKESLLLKLNFLFVIIFFTYSCHFENEKQDNSGLLTLSKKDTVIPLKDISSKTLPNFNDCTLVRYV